MYLLSQEDTVEDNIVSFGLTKRLLFQIHLLETGRESVCGGVKGSGTWFFMLK